MKNVYDIIIVGAGPSGCASALALHGSGLKVALVDKETFPRDKPCGDAIPVLALKAMDYINPEWGQQLRQFTDNSDVYQSKIVVPNGKSFSIEWVLLTYNCKRLHFDNFLMQHVVSNTETTVIQNNKLKNVAISDSNVLCELEDGSTLESKIIIGCDGVNSVVRKQLGEFKLKDLDTSGVVRGYYTGITGLEKGVNEFHFFKDKSLLPGYLWIFPFDDGSANVGFGLLNEKKKSDKESISLLQNLNNIIQKHPKIAPRFKNAELQGSIKGFMIPLGTKKRKISGNRFMLCGDAASIVDPLQGHGIDKAMWSGIFAAKQAISCIKQQDFSSTKMQEYDKKLYNKIGPELKRNTFIMYLIIYFPFLLNLSAFLGKNKKRMRFTSKVLKL